MRIALPSLPIPDEPCHPQLPRLLALQILRAALFAGSTLTATQSAPPPPPASLAGEETITPPRPTHRPLL